MNSGSVVPPAFESGHPAALKRKGEIAIPKRPDFQAPDVPRGRYDPDGWSCEQNSAAGTVDGLKKHTNPPPFTGISLRSHWHKRRGFLRKGGS